MLLLAGCAQEQQESYPYFYKPEGFPDPVYQPAEKGANAQGYYLGKKLFFDPILSYNQTISCGSCHHQINAFADQGVAFSVGVDGQHAKRNSPPIFNLAWMPNFMWDGGVNHIEVMPVAPITNHLEMGSTLQLVVNRLNNSAEYQGLFAEVFGDSIIDSQKMLISMAWYLTSIVSANSKYDRVMKGEQSFTASEEEGHQLFQQHCTGCHAPPLFTDYSYKNNGLDMVFADSGRGRITLLAEDMGRFKVPTLRNVELTGPYMHDGRFVSLEQVMDHYNGGLVASPGLDGLIPPGGFLLTTQQKQSLIDFLKTLTDYDLITNEVY